MYVSACVSRDEAIVPDIKAGKRLVVVAHANSLRSLFKKVRKSSTIY
jgi:bisphosphoglycerate-dependent phosphoglycerate mutase